MPSLSELIDAMDEWFVPAWAEPWDAVGLVCGDPGEPVRRVVLAVDPVPATVAEAVGVEAQLLITHHPLLLTPVHGVPADDPAGGLIHRMIRSGVAHFVAHTNADVADPGVSDALAARLGITATQPLVPQPDTELVKLVVFVPTDSAPSLVDALAGAGAGAIGSYERCVWTSAGTGSFRPLAGAAPAVGSVGEIATVAETRVEMVVAPRHVPAVVSALRSAHPYEEPAFDLLRQVGVPSRRGSGRVGELPAPMTLGEFTAHAARSLPSTSWGVRAAGDPAAVLRRVAVCGGSGSSYLDAARAAGADVFLTADLKHHVTSDAVTDPRRPMALVDAAHWATEAPWLDAVGAALVDRFGTSLDVHVSQQVTDPWTLHSPSPETSTPRS
jgi:dinuclear metal center YbgI/SA1388 family protein